MAAETPLSPTHHSAETLSGELLATSLSLSLCFSNTIHTGERTASQVVQFNFESVFTKFRVIARAMRLMRDQVT